MKRKRYFVLILIMTLVVLVKLNWYENIDRKFLSLDKCPSCYGLDCENISSDALNLISYSRSKLFNLFFNVKNVYYGRVGTTKCVVKKLAHTDELIEFDKTLCTMVELPSTCDVGEAISVLVDKYDHNLTAVVERNAKLFEHSEITKCNHRRILPFLYERFRHLRSHNYQLHHFITLLAINPEPLVMEAFRGLFPFPLYFGACGRVIVEEFAGRSLSNYYEESWSQRANLALQLLRIADAMTHSEIRIYLTDPSSDNFAVDNEGTLKMVDLENVVLVDSREQGLDKSVHFNEGFGCTGCFSYDYEDLCHHSTTDHNYFAVCKGLLSSTPFSSSLPGGLLHTIPKEVLEKAPNLPTIIEECAQPKIPKNRIQPGIMLSRALSDLLQS